MKQQRDGGVLFEARAMPADEYLPNKRVFLAGMLGKTRGDRFGLYFGRIEPGCAIERESHDGTTETVYVLSGRAEELLRDRTIPMSAGHVLHVDAGVPHGLRNVGTSVLEFLVIGSPDFRSQTIATQLRRMDGAMDPIRPFS